MNFAATDEDIDKMIKEVFIGECPIFTRFFNIIIN